jgi:hypothetical protein
MKAIAAAIAGKGVKFLAYLITSGLVVVCGFTVPPAAISEVVFGLIAALGALLGSRAAVERVVAARKAGGE